MANVAKSVYGYPVYDAEAHKRIDETETTVREQVKQLAAFRTDTEQAINEMQANITDQMQTLNKQTQTALSEMDSSVAEMEGNVNEALQTAQETMNTQLSEMQTTVNQQMDSKQAEINQSLTDLQTTVNQQLSEMEQKIPETSEGLGFSIQTGTLDNVGTSGVTVPFATPFASVPVVVACGGSETASVKVSSVTTESFLVTSAVSNNDGVQWIAVGINAAS